MFRSGRSDVVVIPVLVTGIQRTACSGVSGAVDPENKSRDDKGCNNG
jgi:hypothetical protein